MMRRSPRTRQGRKRIAEVVAAATADVVDVDVAVVGDAEVPGDEDVASKSDQKDWESNSETRSMSPNRRPKRDGTCATHQSTEYGDGLYTRCPEWMRNRITMGLVTACTKKAACAALGHTWFGV
jgi:hypothetical protein